MTFHFSSLRMRTFLLALVSLAIGTGSALAAPHIIVKQPDGTALTYHATVAASSTVTLPGVKVGTNGTLQTFTIENPGDAALTTNVVSSNSSIFTVGPQPGSVSATGSETFTVQFKPTASGLNTATLTITNGDTTKSPFYVKLEAQGLVPDIEVFRGTTSGTALVDNATPAQNLGSSNVGTAGSPTTFTIRNSSSVTVPLAGLSLSSSNSEFAVSTLGATSLAPNATTTFTVTFTPSARNLRTGVISIASDDPNENPFEVNVSGTGLAPEIRVTGPTGSNINSGGSLTFPSTVRLSTTKQEVTIHNDGTATLNVAITGISSGQFGVGSPPSPTIPSGSSSTFFLEFTPSSTGLQTQTMSITNNDPDGSEAPFTISLRGTGTAPLAGQDSFGYRMASSPANGLALNAADPDVVDVAELTGDDDAQSINIGFPFSFYENTYTSLTASTNGLISFGDAYWPQNYAPSVIPSSSDTNNIIAAFWTDLQKGSGSKILYTTRGSIPNRVFILDYVNMEEFSNSSARVSFQLLLYEGSNEIEIQFKKINGLETDRGLTIGIENAAGNDGINVLASQTDRPAIPSAIKFSRPVLYDVIAEYDRPDGTTHPILGTGFDPILGPGKADFEAVQQFEAPEYIYLDRNFNRLSEVGDVNGSNDSIAWYRLVNNGYAIDGQVVQGTQIFFTTTLTHDVTVVWRWRLECAVIVESATGDGGLGNPDPLVGRSWYEIGEQLTAGIDSTVQNDEAGLRFRSTGYTVSDPFAAAVGLGSYPATTTGSERQAIAPISITDALRVKWNWTGQTRYRISASGTDTEDPTAYDSQAYVKVYNAAGTAVESDTFATGDFTDIWVDVGRKIEVGCFYRTIDRCFTLTDFLVPLGGDLTQLGSDISRFEDDNRNGRVTRAYTIDMAEAPTELRWIFQRTIFRAEIPLGQAFDPRNPNVFLTPALCDGAVLSLNGPVNLVTEQVSETPDGTIGDNPNPIRWDKVGQNLHPVHPGSNRIEWPDANNPGDAYRIEIVSGFSGDEMPLASEREASNGARLTSELPNGHPVIDSSGSPVLSTPNNLPLYYVYKTNPLADIAANFPAAPAAHYRHLYDPAAGRRPPTKLDLSKSDEWAFQELTYSDDGVDATVNPTEAGTLFETARAGRSVLLFSFRPNPDEAADGNTDEEAFAVRVIESSPIVPLLPTDEKFVLGMRGLGLGPDEEGNQPEAGLLQRGGNTVASVDPGSDFVIDFWVNAEGLETDDGPVTLLSTGGDKLTVTLDAENSLITTTYLGLTVSHPFPQAGPTWRHCVIHGFDYELFGYEATVIDFYLDGVREEQAVVSNLLATLAPASSVVGTELTSDSLRFGTGTPWRGAVQLDQFRMFSLPDSVSPWLNSGELIRLRTVRNMNAPLENQLRNTLPLLWFNFESPPATGTFQNFGTLADVGIGPVATSPGTNNDFAASWSRVALQEVATRLNGTLDNANFGGSGYIINTISNYNANLYNREAEVGSWGPIYPVNDSQLFLNPTQRLEVAYYENPYLSEPSTHPNVAWPYETAAYNQVIYPTFGPHRNKAIYIASRVGSEGVDLNGRPQKIYDLETYSDLAVYNQPLPETPGYNPNEEHALAAASSRAGLKIKNAGDDIPNNPPLAAFALQNDINTASNGYTSDPWVLIQVNNLSSGEPEMAAYRVYKGRPGSIPFPRPTDAIVDAIDGLEFESAPQPENRFLTMDPDEDYDFCYAFTYPVFAGDLLIPPYPLNLVVGNVSMPDDKARNEGAQITFWRDVKGTGWVISGGGTFVHQFHYPYREDFYMPTAVAPGTPVAWVPDNEALGRRFTGEDLEPGTVLYSSSWRSDYPKLKRGETLTYQGGEYFNENPGSNGLPALVAMKAAEVVYDVATPTMLVDDANVDDYSARIIRPLDRHEAPFTVGEMADAGFSPAATAKIFVVAERWYFAELPGSLQRRFYFDSLAEKLVFRGYLNDKDSGNSDLTAGPDPLNLLEPNVLTNSERKELESIGESSSWANAVALIFQKSQNPSRIRDDNGDEITGRYLAGLKESPNLTKRLGLNLDLFSAEADLVLEREKLDALVALENERLRFVALGIPSLGTPTSLTGGTPLPGENSFGSLLTPVAPFLINGQGAKTEDIDNQAAEVAALEDKVSSYIAEISDLAGQNSDFASLDSFGVGSALVCNPKLLTASTDLPRYVTIVENNRAELDGDPISLHIVEIIPDRYRGAIKVVEAANAFSERVTLQHNGEFGANTEDLYYEWWIRDATSLDLVADEVFADGTLKAVDSQGNSLWQQYLPERTFSPAELAALGVDADTAKHLGLHSIVFEGRPDVTLADKLVLMRYRHKSEQNWNLVPFEFSDAAAEWQPGTPAPFQWAGAANSPQLQADGSKRYIPQLVMGWVKRVLDRINPYEARYTDFFGNESPATYSSQIQIAGAPFAGKVALNDQKNVIENTGLIELYETVLQRARELSIDNSSNPVATDGINQAILLAATRLAVLYELLAREAYSDAQDSTITVTSSSNNNLASVVSFTHAFQNYEPDVLHEELSLLRGTDFRKSYPVFNRMFWNYAKGLGEAAYNVNYNIYDEDTDGIINEDDARALYPQGHGDAWGHFLSALGMHYELLQQPVFSWKSRPELYSLLQNVLEVDYLDERTFAKLAAGRAQAGRDIVRGTYRLNYTQDPDGQWQGYTDATNPARAWGVSEWAHRSGFGAYVDWAVGNAILPDDAADGSPLDAPENLDQIERLGALDEITMVSDGLYEIQVAMDEANSGANPLGFDSDAISFDINPFFEGASWDGKTHFEQTYENALEACGNALTTLNFATKVGNKMRYIEDDTQSLLVEAIRQDIDYRNRLIEIFGRPYDGTIGFGKIYPEGYQGPDNQLFSYLDATNINQLVPQTDENAESTVVRFPNLFTKATGLADTQAIQDLYADVLGNFFENIGAAFTRPFGETLGVGSSELTEAFVTLEGTRTYEDFSSTVRELEVPVRQQSPYAFQAPADWGQRTSYGKIQRILEEELRERIALETDINNYVGFLQNFEVLTNRLKSEIELIDQRESIQFEISIETLISKAIQISLDSVRQGTAQAGQSALLYGNAASEGFPKVVGFSNDVTSVGRAGVLIAAASIATGTGTASKTAEVLKQVAQFAIEALKNDREYDIEQSRDIATVEGYLLDLVAIAGDDLNYRNAIASRLGNIELKRQEYFTAQAEGFRLLREREAYNKMLASKVQRNRYQDMVLRMSRNEAITKYQTAYNHAARYTWLAARAYDYETSLDPGDPAAPGALLDQIVKERQLGLWSNGQPQTGQGGLAEILHDLNGNFQVLKGQLGLNNAQSEIEKISLRSELFRIGPGAADGGNASSDDRWEDALKARIVPDLNQMPEFVRHCRPFAGASSGPQPGMVIRFSSSINPGENFFGLPLAPGDHSYSSANFATKVRGFGVWLENYNSAGLSTTPRAYMIPAGNDYLRASNSAEPLTRMWTIREQRIPTPFVINDGNLASPGFIPTLNGVDGDFSAIRRHGDFRMYHDDGNPQADDSELILNSRLIGRSVWNSDWLLIIPGANLSADPKTGLTGLAESVSDIKLHFKTYSQQGQ